MKEYVKPILSCVELRSEESFSLECKVGCCDENKDGVYEYVSPSASQV